MIISVTAEDIADCTRLDPMDCAVARAVNREIPGQAEVRAGSITLHGGSVPIRIETPFLANAAIRNLTHRIHEIDAGRGEPFRFSLNRDGQKGYVYSEVVEHAPEAALA